MGTFRFITAWQAFLAMSLFALPAVAASIKLDGGIRTAIYDENYKAGLGGELGLLKPLSEDWDIGLHLNYLHFRIKTENWTPVDEMGGYVTAYIRPKLNLDFSLRLGPHIGFSYVKNPYADLGGDLMAYYGLNPNLDLYAAFIPSFLIGKNSQAMIRIGLGLEYSLGN